ncbi:hypothetical protein VEE15_45920 [Escherichia coli]|nr:hypothetical protein VEE15_45920 [Escherichia coli]
MNRFVVAEPLWCTGCNTCLAACSDVHKTQGLQQHPRLALAKTSTLTAPVVCHHCEEAPCLQVCPVNAISQRDDAIQLNESLCIGCKLCAVVCPFGAISASGSRPVNAPAQYVFQAEGSLKDGEENAPTQHALLRWEPGVQTVAVKCDLCDFLPEGPACVRACPNQALRLITDDSLQRQMKENTAPCRKLVCQWQGGSPFPHSGATLMDALQLLTWSLILYLFASLASLFLLGLDRLAIKLSGITSLVGGVIGIISGITQLHEGVTLVARFATPFDFADLTLRMDSLSAFMVLVISLLVVVCSLYSLTYMREYEGKGAAAMGFFMNIFIASMVALLVMDNAFWFIVLFEMMSLSSWFLVIARQDKTSINAGMLYFFIAHAGSVLIMIAFLLMGRESGSLDFASFRTLSLSPGLASAVFLLAFFGFGAKAGMMPLHSWLPRAHPAAPSHASALMSGVMVKIGIFGILKVAMDLLAQTGLPLWWGILVMAIGAISALLGVLYALAEQDIKRLLAWSTVGKRRHYFAGSRCGDGRSVTARPAAHRGWTARRTVSSAQPCAVQRAAISRRGRDYFAFAYPRHGKNRGTGETDAVDSRSMPDWLPRDISHSSAEWFYQRMVHLAVAVLTKSCGSRSATTCGSYCYGNAGSHWWAGSNVLRQNVRYYFLWCAAQYTR